MFRIGSHRRRRRGSPLVVAAIVGAFIGYDYVRDSLQRRQEWTGTVMRAYDERPLFSKRRSRRNLYWEVRTDEGGTQTVLIRSRSFWSQAQPGDRVVKKAGELLPQLYASH